MALAKALSQYLMSHNGGVKLVLIARTDIGMKKGKIASQCAHAAIACYKQALITAPDELNLWESLGQPKIVLRSDVDGEECLLRLFEQAETLNLVSILIRDAGHTQVERGSITVLGIGPGKASIIDTVTKNLKLL